MRRASLPLYRLDGIRSATAALWSAIAFELEREGIEDVPSILDFDAPAVPERIGEEVLFSQVCGFPLQTLYRGQAALLGAPVYDFEHCEGATHVGLFVVRAIAPYRSLGDLRGGHFIYNSRHSNSGMNLPRLALAQIAEGRPLFARVEEGGSQVGNLDRVLRGSADATCVDSVTWGYYRHCLPEWAAGLRVLAATRPSPTIPYITSSATDARTTDALRGVLQRIGKDDRWVRERQALFLRDIVPVGEATYAPLLNLARAARELGYPEIA